MEGGEGVTEGIGEAPGEGVEAKLWAVTVDWIGLGVGQGVGEGGGVGGVQPVSQSSKALIIRRFNDLKCIIIRPV